MELSSVVAVLRRWSLTLIASALVAGSVAYLVASRVPPTYAADAEVLVGPINTDENTLGAAQELVQTYGELIRTDRILLRVIDALALDVDVAELRDTVTVRTNAVPRMLSIRALAGDPETAAAIANETVAALDAVASEGQIRPEGEVNVVTSARPALEPVQPQVSLIVALAAGAGFVTALAAVLLIDYFSNTVNGRSDLQRVTQAPFLGSIAARRRLASRGGTSLVVDTDPNSPASLAYRLLASRITAGDPGRELKNIVVLGAEGHEASGEVAANLAAVLALGARRVRLVDANDVTREITRTFNLDASHPIGDLATEDDDIITRMTTRVAPGIEVIPRPPGSDPHMHEVGHLRASLDRLARDADAVVISTAPIHRSASALVWAREADAAILVARRDRTKRDQLAFSADTLRTIGTPLLGSVFHSGSSRFAPEDAHRGPAAGALSEQARPAGSSGKGRT